MFVGYVVRQLELVKRDDLLGPLLSGGRRVRMDVHPFWHFRVGLSGNHPAAEIVRTKCI